VLGQRLSNPHVLAVVGSDEQDEAVAGSIIRVKEVCDYAQQAEAPGQDDELIFLAQLFKDVLLEFL
jgi:hypothetical protein